MGLGGSWQFSGQLRDGNKCIFKKGREVLIESARLYKGRDHDFSIILS